MDYIAHLKRDKKLAEIIKKPVGELPRHKNVPLLLIYSIMNQQLSTKVAAVIKRRFLELYDGNEPDPERILITSPETLRATGLSNAKVNYIHNVARFCLEQSISDIKLQSMTDTEIIELLTQIKGVGRWTVEMLLMFTLGREDIFVVDDLGIQQAMIKLYKLNGLDKKRLKEKLLKISSKWSPHRTYACVYLWQWKDIK